MTEDLTGTEQSAIFSAFARCTGTNNVSPLLAAMHDIVEGRETAAQRRGYDDAIQRVRDAHANCIDECDLCIVRDEMLDDLSDPYPATEVPS